MSVNAGAGAAACSSAGGCWQCRGSPRRRAPARGAPSLSCPPRHRRPHCPPPRPPVPSGFLPPVPAASPKRSGAAVAGSDRLHGGFSDGRLKVRSTSVPVLVPPAPHTTPLPLSRPAPRARLPQRALIALAAVHERSGGAGGQRWWPRGGGHISPILASRWLSRQPAPAAPQTFPSERQMKANKQKIHPPSPSRAHLRS